METHTKKSDPGTKMQYTNYLFVYLFACMLVNQICMLFALPKVTLYIEVIERTLPSTSISLNSVNILLLFMIICQVVILCVCVYVCACVRMHTRTHTFK